MSMKDDEVQRYVPPVKTISIHNDVDEIVAYLQGDTDNKVMSKTLQEKYDRLKQCAEWTRKYGSRSKVVPMMVQHFKINETTAYRDFNDAQEVFSVTQINQKMFWVDMLLGMMMSTREKALTGDKKDFRTAAAIEKNMAEIITTHFGDKDAELYKKLVIPQIIVTTDPSILGTTLPDDWREQVKQWISPAPKMNMKNIPEAEIEEEESDD